MNKISLSNLINHKADLVRIITSSHKLDFYVGSVYDNRGKAESWSDDDSTMQFMPENDGDYIYALMCDSVPCFKVDYDNEEITKLLNAENCQSEGEVLVSPKTKMKVTSNATDHDYEEMGYYQIILKLI